ncbi:DUF882 domain-containing protein [Methyloligella sp. GL2]|uniref:DUF882 domain-containing protein n=1 Tax=Methyloligella sp. GL2 TaxID=2742204 RepID=UPI001ABB1ED2|nr:DUF882 domain-containing protein [Methyloligella sp. GL2]
MAAILLLPDFNPANANAVPRTLRFYNIHTKEYLTVTYKVNDRYVPSAMDKLNRFMGDWRRNEPTKMDPELIDLIWTIYTRLGASEPIHLISGYRSKKTNDALRAKGGGQAKYSQHTLGKAADIHIPGVPVKRLRNMALIQEWGGVGYYPNSGIPFVHVDTGRVRMWPRIPHMELAALFPSGKTAYVPSDGRMISKRDYQVASASGKYATAGQVLGSGASAVAIAAADMAPPPMPDRSPIHQVALASAGSGMLPKVFGASEPQPMALGQADAPVPAVAENQAPATMPMPERKGFIVASAGGSPFSTAPAAPQAEPAVFRAGDAPSLPPAPASAASYQKTDVLALPAEDDEHPEESLSYIQYDVATLLTERSVGYDRTIAPLQAPEQSRIAYLFEDLPVPQALELRDSGRVMSLARRQGFEGAAVKSLYAALPGRTQLASR